MYMLDTDICIYLRKRQPESVYKRFDKLDLTEICISSITYAELLFGAQCSRNVQENIKVVEEFGRLVRIMPFDEAGAQSYAIIRSCLRKQGAIIGANDLLIAAHALSMGITLVTNNAREFSRVPGLKVENWVNA